MRSEHAVGLLAVLFVGAACIAGCAGGTGDSGIAADAGGPVVATETGTLTGQTVALRDEAPIAGAHVFVAGREAVTDAQGSFVVEDVATGTQLLSVDGYGYTILGGPIEVEVTQGVTDVGRIVLGEALIGVPPAAPGL